MSANVFVYGTLQLAEVMRAVTGKSFTGQPAVLSGYVRLRMQGATYPGIRREAGAETEGILCRAVDAASLALLDSFEGEQYERRSVTVMAADGREYAAQVYVVAPAYLKNLSDEPWDLDQFRDRHLAGFMADPEER